MEELSQGSETSGVNPQIAPDRISYTTLMRAHISLGKAGFAERVESILRHLRQEESNSLAKPDAKMYSVVLDAWARSGDPNAHTRAEALVQQMNDDFAAGNMLVQPTIICMNSRKSHRIFSYAHISTFIQSLLPMVRILSNNIIPIWHYCF
jgi:hypothetical protein